MLPQGMIFAVQIAAQLPGHAFLLSHGTAGTRKHRVHLLIHRLQVTRKLVVGATERKKAKKETGEKKSPNNRKTQKHSF
jgi:hypothetical protein